MFVWVPFLKKESKEIDTISEVLKRYNDELKVIIDNNYSVLYISAKKCIDYSKENVNKFNFIEGLLSFSKFCFSFMI